MSIPDVTFINLPSPFLEDNTWVYPLGILNIATYTKNLGYSVDFLDLAPLTKECIDDDRLTQLITEMVQKIKSPYIGVSAVTPQYKYLSLIPKISNKRLIAGGAHATIFPQDVLELGYESVVAGEGELVIDSILKGSTGIHRSNQIVNIDDIPFPDRSYFKGYRGPSPVMAGRGCPFQCTFCAKIDGEAKTRFRNPKSVIEELLTIPNDNIIFYDDTFTLKKSWLEELCNGIIDAGIKKSFRCSTRADRLTPEVVQLLKSAGFVEVCVGVESGSQRILDNLQKKTKVIDNSEAIKICHEQGLKFKAFMMLGNPGEGEESVQETYDWIRQNRPDKLGLYVFYPLPGCDIYDNPQRYDIQFEKESFDKCYYGGKRNEILSKVSTSSLTREKITKYYNKFLIDFKGMLY